MNTNNCMRNVSLIALCMATASTQCMLNGLKTVITCVGTAIGVGLPTVPFLMVAKKAYTLTKNPDASIEEQNASTQAIESIKKHFLGVSMYTEDEQKKFDQPLYKPSSQEEKFLRQYIPHPTRIVMNPLPKTSCSIPLSGVVFIENKTFASEKTLEQALEQNDHETLKTFAAIAQHENEHIKNKDGLNIIIPKTTLPLITTTVATKNVKKIFPYKKSSSLMRHVGRLGAKTGAGITLLATNACLNLYLTKKISHARELRADKGVTPDNIDGLEKHFLAIEKRQEPVNDAIVKIAEIIVPHWFNTKHVLKECNHITHPPHELRIAALRANAKKT